MCFDRRPESEAGKALPAEASVTVAETFAKNHWEWFFGNESVKIEA